MKSRDRLAHNILDQRRALGISQEELALRAGISRGYMGRVENSKFSATLDLVDKIAGALEVDPAQLLEKR
ncbi:helix-turn-helix transcriptional regulator [Sulfitobacter sp. F26204]|uniref:helix-turn-helix domain-containing protein n=1 Tax=Sulfitobacter sp. F26204 TaxID=2996014 RepID=UPI00225DE79E|nr:helix-turn-helix transcriptional regulator [Sulfitobacter sp. F26204]MCX7561536.1 helix-turn-helix transcriptional regulator [Sulfitobacter sp. F26204]